jgi:hypothetical protein
MLTSENELRMVVTNSPTQCQISWPTSMAALSGIPARLVAIPALLMGPVHDDDRLCCFYIVAGV